MGKVELRETFFGNCVCAKRMVKKSSMSFLSLRFEIRRFGAVHKEKEINPENKTTNFLDFFTLCLSGWRMAKDAFKANCNFWVEKTIFCYVLIVSAWFWFIWKLMHWPFTELTLLKNGYHGRQSVLARQIILFENIGLRVCLLCWWGAIIINRKKFEKRKLN